MNKGIQIGELIHRDDIVGIDYQQEIIRISNLLMSSEKENAELRSQLEKLEMKCERWEDRYYNLLTADPSYEKDRSILTNVLIFGLVIYIVLYVSGYGANPLTSVPSAYNDLVSIFENDATTTELINKVIGIEK